MEWIQIRIIYISQKNLFLGLSKQEKYAVGCRHKKGVMSE